MKGEREEFSSSPKAPEGFLRPTRSVVSEARPSAGEMESICEMKNYPEKVAEVFSPHCRFG